MAKLNKMNWTAVTQPLKWSVGYAIIIPFRRFSLFHYSTPNKGIIISVIPLFLLQKGYSSVFQSQKSPSLLCHYLSSVSDLVSPHVMEFKTVLDSGLQARDSGFQKLARFRNPQVRICRIPNFLTGCVGETYLFINHF